MSAAIPTQLDPLVIGKKAAAMAYFSRIGLFDQGLTIIGPIDRATALDRVRAIDVGPKGATLRFSHGEELGLPRFFVRTREELVDCMFRAHESSWTTIVHPYIDVRRSFELNIEADSWLLEHVPGMWESENILLPDTLRSVGYREVEADLYVFERSARVASCRGTWSVVESAPLRVSTVQDWARRLLPILETLRHDLCSDIPINVHFVEDGESRWHFLNVRPGFSSADHQAAALPSMFFPMTSIDDLDHWDGLQPILLQATTPRGSESSLASVALALKKRTSTVYVDFGVLSHPAIVLREFGLRVISTSRISSNQGKQQFEHHRFFS